MWCTGLVALWHVGSSQTRDRIHVPCIGRRILNHRATKEVLKIVLLELIKTNTNIFFSVKETIIPHLTLEMLSHEFQNDLPLFFLLQRLKVTSISLYYINSIGAEVSANLHLAKDYYLLKSNCILSFLHKKSLC